ncbi:MAG: peptidoglycan binding domain-containing protein, partial [bacterium]|nr:peptidoglycan binding domain-containing protein [bacterium]
MSKKKQKKHNLPFFFLPALIFGLGGIILLFNLAYAQKIYPRVRIANLDLGGKTREEARAILESRVNYFQTQGLKIVYKEREWPLGKEDLGLVFNLDAAISRALSFGHEKNIAERLKNQARLLASPVDLPMQYVLDEDKLDQYLKNNLAFLETKPENAKIVLEDARFQIISEQSGQTIDWGGAKEKIAQALDR